jgi:uncharacterized membrane protein (UPF0127 family)
MSWLVRDGTKLAPADVAPNQRARRRGLLGRDCADEVLVLRPCRQVHTIGMRFPIDVAWCTRDGHVLRATRMVPGRLSRAVRHAHFVIEAPAGAFDDWQLAAGDVLDVVS